MRIAILKFVRFLTQVYGTYNDPIQGWVGNANSGHLGLLVGFVKGKDFTATSSDNC